MSQKVEQNNKVMKLRREEKQVHEVPVANSRKREQRKVEKGNPSHYMPISSVKTSLNTENQNRSILRHIVV